MLEEGRRLFVGIKVSTELQRELDRPAPGTEPYFDGSSADYLQVVTAGNEKLIGKFLADGFPAADMDNVSRNLCSILRRIARNYRVEEKAVCVYVV